MWPFAEHRPLWVAIAGAVLVFTSGCAGNTTNSTGPRTFSLDGKPMAECTVTGTRGIVMAAKCGTLTVLENRADSHGRKIALSVAVMPATEPGSPSAPVFFIAGGPGGSTISDWAEAPLIFAGLNAHHDVVLVDQRGTGQSHMLVFPAQDPRESSADYAARALATLDGNPRYYTTAVAMDDLDAVRQALGYDKIDLYGASYGATAVQYYLRQHGDRVRAAVLDGGTLVEVPIFELIAPNSQRALDDAFARCAADTGCATAFPDVRTEFASVIARLSTKPVPTSDRSQQPACAGRRLCALRCGHRLRNGVSRCAHRVCVCHRATQHEAGADLGDGSQRSNDRRHERCVRRHDPSTARRQ